MTMISEYVDCKNLTSYISKNGKNITGFQKEKKLMFLIFFFLLKKQKLYKY